MNKVKLTTQKLKGKAKQIKGKVEEKIDHPVKGKIDEVQGN
jgi:uncharacterized protein YjbJ (UPF0337 family)